MGQVPARIHISRGFTQWVRQSLELAPEIEGTFVCSSMEAPRVAPVFVMIPGRAWCDRLQHPCKITPHHHPTDRTQASQITQGCAWSDRMLSSHQRWRKTIRSHWRSNRRKTMVCSELQRKKCARANYDHKIIHQDSKNGATFPQR